MNYKSISTILILAVIAFVSFVSCKKTEVPVCDGSSPTYDDDIKVIIDNNWILCHDAGSGDGDYTTYVAFSEHRSSGEFESSVLIKQNMPQSSSNILTEVQLSKIQCWVENGYPEN